MKIKKPDYNQEDKKDYYGVHAIIKDSEGKILVQKHIKYGFWTIPLGKVTPGDDVEDGFKKEMLEECGIRVIRMKKVNERKDIYIIDGKKVRDTKCQFEVLEYSGKIENKEPEKHSEQRFMSVEEIKKLPYLSDGTILYLESLGIKRSALIK
ncbi:MAG: NUDIX hydrolase [archaeon]